MTLREEEPVINAKSISEQGAPHEKWTHSNRVCSMVMKYTMEKTIRQSVFESEKAKIFYYNKLKSMKVDVGNSFLV